MKIKRILITEGAKFIHAICLNQPDALKWQRKLLKCGNYKSVEFNPATEVEVGGRHFCPPYKFVVSAEKIGVWFSDEFPFRAGIGMLFRNTVIDTAYESKLAEVGIIKRGN